MTLYFPYEKDLENFIHKKIIDDKICPVDNSAWPFVLKQFSLGGYGIPDLIKIKYEDNNFVFCILELKNKPFLIENLIQVARYCTGLKHYLATFHPKLRYTIETQLVVTELDTTSEIVFLYNAIDVDIFVYGCSLSSGWECKQIEKGWRQTSPCFQKMEGSFSFAKEVIKHDK